MDSNYGLRKREMMRFEKRKEICSTDAYFEYSCPDGSYCVGTRSCRQRASYAWTAVFGVIVLLALIYVCVRRSRARSAMASQQPVVTTTIVPGQEQQYAQYAPPQNFAPPPGDPNMAYQTPPSYPPPAGAAYPPPGSSPYPPPGASPYGEKPPGSYGPPMEAPPAAYSPYPQTSGAYSPAPAAYSAAPAGAYPHPRRRTRVRHTPLQLDSPRLDMALLLLTQFLKARPRPMLLQSKRVKG
ncbi:unnamed protein product [Mortierella alpina]